LNPLPLPVAQPKQIPAHNFKSFPPKNHYLIVSAKGLMSSNPNQANADRAVLDDPYLRQWFTASRSAAG
ncbi:MAG: hypothetical protein ACREDT_15800, partial [Methylocella sp.]